MNFGIVGLGRMGTALGRSLVLQGVAVHGYDREPQARRCAADVGLVVHDELADLASACDTVATSLPTTAAVRSVVFDLGDVLCEGSLVIETSTSSPAFARSANERLARRGVRFVDAPVSGKAPHLTILVGGEQGVLGDAGDVLELAASAIVYLGRPGDGYTAKLLQQYVKYARFLVAAEALTFAQHEAMDLSATLAALQAGTGALPGLGSAEDYFLGDGPAVAARAPVSTITKDLELTRTMFVEAGFRSPSFESLAEFFLAADSEALHDRPYPEVVGLLEAFRYSQEARR